MRAESGQTSRRILCVFPRYTKSFGTFQNSYALMDGVAAFMPPQGLLLIAAYLPEEWSVRFVDENIRPATPDDFEWADAVFVSGMHIQRQQMNDMRQQYETRLKAMEERLQAADQQAAQATTTANTAAAAANNATAPEPVATAAASGSMLIPACDGE